MSLIFPGNLMKGENMEMNEELINAISGVLVIDKPVGLTSHEVVQIVRRGTYIRRAGHTGTLDPRASGVLVVLVGPAVRLSEYVSASDKRYQAVIQLGKTTDTYDADGKTLTTNPVNITEEQFEEALHQFIGEIEQVPPPYSAPSSCRTRPPRGSPAGATRRRASPSSAARRSRPSPSASRARARSSPSRPTGRVTSC